MSTAQLCLLEPGFLVLVLSELHVQLCMSSWNDGMPCTRYVQSQPHQEMTRWARCACHAFDITGDVYVLTHMTVGTPDT